jgi:AraC-like DNA-binding protein
MPAKALVQGPKESRVMRDFTHQDMIYSSNGSRWNGIPVGCFWAPPGTGSAEFSQTRAFCVYTSERVSYSAFGSRKHLLYTPASTIFLREGIRITDHAAMRTGYRVGVATLEQCKVSEFTHDDVSVSSLDFRELVVAEDEQLSGILKAMIAEGVAGNPAGDLMSQSLSVALLTHIYGRYDRPRAAKRLKGKLSASQISCIRQYVTDNVGQDLSVLKLASVVNLSPWYFSRTFTKTVGVSPYRFVINNRIALARTRLLDLGLPDYAELAKDLGFASQSHFCSSFQRFVGCSPDRFRRQML